LDFPSRRVETHLPDAIFLRSADEGFLTETIFAPPRLFFLRASAALEATTAVFRPAKKYSFFTKNLPKLKLYFEIG
jgi:hypothetical protein